MTAAAPPWTNWACSPHRFATARSPPPRPRPRASGHPLRRPPSAIFSTTCSSTANYRGRAVWGCRRRVSLGQKPSRRLRRHVGPRSVVGIATPRRRWAALVTVAAGFALLALTLLWAGRDRRVAQNPGRRTCPRGCPSWSRPMDAQWETPLAEPTGPCRTARRSRLACRAEAAARPGFGGNCVWLGHGEGDLGGAGQFRNQ